MQLGVNGSLGIGILNHFILTVSEPALNLAAGELVLPLDGPTSRLLSSLFEMT